MSLRGRACAAWAAVAAATGAAAGDPLCHMMYLNADNNLEAAIIADLGEVASNSAFLAREGYSLYVVIDRGFLITREVVPYTYLGNFGSPVARTNASQAANLYELYEGKLYQRTADVPAFSGGEVDMDSASTLKAFLDWALDRCLLTFADSDRVLTFLQAGSHGYGWYGFGGDWNNGASRAEVLANRDFADKVLESLQARGIDKLDMLGFDACYMSSLWALRQFSRATKYFLASETTEPSHGWAYNALSPTWTDMPSLGRDIIDTYVDGLAGFMAQVSSPKVLTLFDASKFADFLASLDEVFGQLAAGLSGGHLATYSAVTRALASSIKWSTTTDGVITNRATGMRYSPRSAVDVVSFLDRLASMCLGGSSAELVAALAASKAKLQAMRVYIKQHGARGVSGLHFWMPELADVGYGAVIRSMVCGTSLAGRCYFSGALYNAMSANATDFFAAYFGDFVEVGDAPAVCVLGEPGDGGGASAFDCPADSQDLVCQSLARELPPSSGPTTTTTPGPGCQSYALRQLMRSGTIDTCAGGGEFRLRTTVTQDVVGVSTEVLFTTGWLDDDSRKPISYIGLGLNTRFEGNEVSANASGLLYRVCDAGCNTSQASNAMVTAHQENAEDEWKVQVHYFPEGTDVHLDAHRRLTNLAQAKNGYLYFKSAGEELVSNVHLFLIEEGIQSAPVPIPPDRGGSIVTVAQPQNPSAAEPIHGGPFNWSSTRDWGIRGFKLGSDLSDGALEYATVLAHLETSRSVGTSCFAKSVFVNVLNRAAADRCAPPDEGLDVGMIGAATRSRLGMIAPARALAVMAAVVAAWSARGS